MAESLLDKMRTAFTDATVFTFSKMIVVNVVPQEAPNVVAQEGFELSGVIDFSGDISGTCELRMSTETASAAVSRVEGETVSGPEEIADGVGEIVNMIAGNAKAAMLGYSLNLDFPEVTSRKRDEPGISAHADGFHLAFGSEIGDVAVIVHFLSPSLSDTKE
jgi:CheY-specific phosphatase CheX